MHGCMAGIHTHSMGELRIFCGNVPIFSCNLRLPGVLLGFVQLPLAKWQLSNDFVHNAFLRMPMVCEQLQLDNSSMLL